MGAVTTRMTVDQYLAVTTEGDHTQLVDGAIVVDDPRLRHGVVQVRLLVAIESWIRGGPDRGLVSPPTNIRLDDRNLYGPDVVYIADPSGVDIDARFQDVPDLVAEIRSPSTWHHDLGVKKRRYEESGLRELWLVDAIAETVLVYRRSTPEQAEFDVELELGGADVLTSPLLPGFALAVAEIFPR